MEYRIKESFLNGDLAEAGFELIYSHLIERRASKSEDKYKHYDFVLRSGQTVDVKSRSKIKPGGYVCVEVINVTGGIGWCHPLSMVDLIAFETSNDFVIVLKQDLLKLLPNKINSTIPREDHIPPKELVGKFGGRKKSKFSETNKDVFTYVLFKDIEKIKIELK